MRITEKLKCGGYCINTKLDYAESVVEMIQRYGQLEDVQEDLGIDLIILFKAVQNGFYDNKGNYYEPYDYLIDLESSCLRENFKDYIKAKTFYFENYGKTWALTKEELL